jgi:tetratricopeptide (TPR) repeat protein
MSAAQENVQRGSWREAGTFFEEQFDLMRYGLGRYGLGTDARLVRAAFLKDVGRTREAIGELERVREAEPLSSMAAYRLGETYLDAGAFSAALAEFDRGLQFRGPRPFLHGGALVTALASGDRQEIDRRLVIREGSGIATQGVSDAMGRFLDDPAGVVAEIQRLRAELTDDPLSMGVLANWAAYYGDAETALELFQELRGRSVLLVTSSMWRPLFDDMRKLPGFTDLVREMGLVDYWREYGWSDFCHPVGDNDVACE